ncbi:tyrosine-type recombinase/integrase [Salinarimonas soli]|uniref:Tyrosine-type recombinase/integrase n=1 Tax=Salinarimonas soli TaxID=1638099 RepID=A0A5B2VQV0_9HYPH|nr:site-specific integrase [Salinarimonas soli]KAA2241164.1 tyrosine-type recombinase/integrase [Salinarimonas soli]
MARLTKRLSARDVATKTEPGRHADGDGLYLVVDAGGARRWVFLYRQNGRLKEMGLGSTNAVSLAEARAKAAECRKQRASGLDPIAARRAQKAAKDAQLTFGAFADALVDELAPGFRNAKHLAQWRMTLKEYAAPLRAKTVDGISTDDVLAVLAPLWTKRPETASRLRGRIERVLDAARARGLRSGENPARWRGHLDQLLPRRKKLTRGHHAAMPFREVPAFVRGLREREGVASLALEFCILTAARSGEVFGARWSEIDRKAKVWTIPAERMKGGREHRVPLTDRALEILAAVETIRTSDYVFPGQRKGRPLSTMAMEMLLRRMKIENATVHGFRSSFRDWAGESTSFPRDVAEAALAHVVGDETERAYRRSDALEKRRRLMAAWAGFVGGGAPDVVTLNDRRRGSA